MQERVDDDEILEEAQIDVDEEEIPGIPKIEIDHVQPPQDASFDQTNDQMHLNPEFRKKTSDQIRRGFLSKLTYDGIWLTPAKKPKLYETAIIFDWDDTILCTSFINPTGVFNPNTRLDPSILQ